MDAKTTKSATDRCLICGRKQKLIRGLCNTHYIQFQKAQKPLSPEEADIFEGELIQAGKLLPSRQGQKSPTNNPFRDMAEQLFGMTADALGKAAVESAATNPPEKKPRKKAKE